MVFKIVRWIRSPRGVSVVQEDDLRTESWGISVFRGLRSRNKLMTSKEELAREEKSRCCAES